MSIRVSMFHDFVEGDRVVIKSSGHEADVVNVSTGMFLVVVDLVTFEDVVVSARQIEAV